MFENNKYPLPDILNDGNVSIEDLESLLKERKAIEMRKEILKEHPPKLTKDGKYYWCKIDGKKYQRISKKAIEDIIVNHYKHEDITIKSLFHDYLERRKVTVSSNTWSKDIYLFNFYIKDSNIGIKPINKLKLSDGYEFVSHILSLNPTMKKRYYLNIRSLLNSIFQFAMDEEYIERNPFENLKPRSDMFQSGKKQRDSDTVFSKAEQSQIIRLAEEDAQADSSSIPLGIVILFMLGLRMGELCALKWGDIETDIRGKYIHIQREMVDKKNDLGKSIGKEFLDHCKTPAGDRRLQLNSKAVSTLHTIKLINQSNNIPTDYDSLIFQRLDKGVLTYCTSRSFDPRLRRYCKKANMSVIKSPHDIRRTALTNLFTAGMPLKNIQAFAGHQSIQQTMDYIRISDTDIDQMQYLETLSEEYETNVIKFRKEA